MHYFSTFFLVLSIVLTGCTSNLQQWTEHELTPYLEKELGQHPRFKDQAIILVDMKGEQIEPQIDTLTIQIRNQVFNRLLQGSGANLTWQSTSIQHHTRIQDVQCNSRQTTRYYIGFDLKPINDQFELSVKALDPEQGSWISGFGKSWQGSLTHIEQKLLTETRPDELLRGLRPLPFNDQQADLLAAYLAKNLTCLLQHSSFENLTLYLDINNAQHLFVNKTLALVGNYLSRFNQVSIVNQPKHAAIILKANLHAINKNLHQLWLIAQDQQTTKNLKGIDTAAYVNLSITADLNTRTPPIWHKPTAISQTSSHLFNSLNIISPVGEPFCRTTTPWVMGEYPLQNNAPIKHCFGLKISLNQTAEVFLLNENSHGQYYRLLPDNGQSQFHLFAGEQLRYPDSNLFDLADYVSEEYVHAIAINNPKVANKFRHILTHLPICCNIEGLSDKSYWHTQLKQLHNQFSNSIDWQIIKVWH